MSRSNKAGAERWFGWALLAWCCTFATHAFLDSEGDETLRSAYDAIRQLDTRLQALQAENTQLRARLQDTETLLAGHTSTLTTVQRDIRTMGLRVNSDFLWTDDDWVLAFRGTAGIGQPVYDAWRNTGHHDDDPMTRATLPCGCTTVNGSLPCDRHYRSRLLDTWPSASIDQVRLVLYENGVEKEHVTFTGTGTDFLSWFSQDRLVDSSWSDLKSSAGINYFSIEGDKTVSRRFYINHQYAGCPQDVGWMVARDSLTEVCDWGLVRHLPAFLYAPSSHEVTWEDHDFREADVMAVFVKFRDDANFGEMCIN